MHLKKIFSIAVMLTLILGFKISFASAAIYYFSPTPADIFDLDHYKYYAWGINWQPQQNEVIDSVQLSIKNINNWIIENTDRLYIHLLNNATQGLTVYTDNQGGGDYFASLPSNQQIHLDTYTDVFDWPGPAENYLYNFDANEISKLAQFSADGNFGLGFDPDCHYWNDGAKLKISTRSHAVPEPTTLALLGSGIGFMIRRRKKS